MNKLLLILLASISLSSAPAFADIPNGCKSNLEDVITSHNDFEAKVPQLIDEGKISLSTIDRLRESQILVAESVALLCAGLKKIELEKSFLGKIGLISEQRAEAAADEAYDAAMDYYYDAITRN